MMRSSLLFVVLYTLYSCQGPKSPQGVFDPKLAYELYTSSSGDISLDRAQYHNQLKGFWLGQCIANWTGLVTEMDKVGSIGEIQTGAFYTREDWGKVDIPNIFSTEPSPWSTTIDFVLRDTSEAWGADDDTDIEYMYQSLLYANETSLLTPAQIRDGWLKHIMADEENFLWVSNQRAFDLMLEGVAPPETSAPDRNEHYEMIDAQLTTEIFGLFAPARPEVALKMAHLPIRTTARDNAAWISEFYVIMHSLASVPGTWPSTGAQLNWMATQAREHLPDTSYSAKMYDFVKSKYESGVTWEEARDAVYQRYQVEEADGYGITSRGLYCNGCFAAGINFAASLVSLFYGEGDFKETVKIGALSGWDSDNPTATWGGLIGFMLGAEALQDQFDVPLSDQFFIHRTRQNFPNEGMDDFEQMANVGLFIVDRAVQEQMSGGVDQSSNQWYIPQMSN
ncbi:MAG: ADP-ribosylglycohydrolase family protein [Bacteroidota bacterium]